MYLTKLSLDAVYCHRQKIVDDYSVHRVVYSFFPEENKTRFLYVDHGVIAGKRELLILSSLIPELPEALPGSTRQIGEHFFSFTQYRFEIILNPVKSVPRSNKRAPIIGQLPLLTYFTERMKKWGFESDLETLQVFTLPSMCFVKKGQSCRMHKVKFRGVLQVTDPALFRQSFESGIGHGKAFGFGMLQLVPIQ